MNLQQMVYVHRTMLNIKKHYSFIVQLRLQKQTYSTKSILKYHILYAL